MSLRSSFNAFTRTAIRRRSELEWIGIFLLIVGIRLWLVSSFGSAVPMYDQWENEGDTLMKPWQDGTLQVKDFFRPHNEHRMVPSKLLAWTLLCLNRQWDERLEMTANAILFSVMAVAIGWATLRLLSAVNRSFVWLVIACWSCFPYAWENTTWGCQSSFYFLIFFSLLALWGLALHRAFSTAWWAGFVAALLAGLSMGSGALAAAAILGLEALRIISTRSFARGGIPTVLVCGGCIALFAWLRVEVPGHEAFKASSFPFWLNTVGRYLSWPFSGTFYWVLVYLPLGLLFASYVRKTSTAGSQRSSRGAEVLLGVGGWVILQAAAMAYARAAQSPSDVPSRYMDILALGAVANCFVVLRAVAAPYRPTSRIVVALAFVWGSCLLAGVNVRTRQELPQAAEKSRVAREAEKSVRAYVATGNRNLLQSFPPWNLPYPWPERLAMLLDDRAIRDILPSTVREPIRLRRENDAGNAFESACVSHLTGSTGRAELEFRS